MMGVSSFAEVPLLYPCQGVSRKRFVVDDESKSMQRITTKSNNHAESPSPQQLAGSSSASSLKNGVIVTTCALLDEPNVLVVSLVQGRASPVMVELDLSQTKMFGAPVKIQSFAQPNSTSVMFRMVDFRGIILSIQLDSSLIPEALQVLSVPHLVEAQLGYFSGAELDSAMVTFLSSTVVVLGLAPHLLAVNLDSSTLEIWSQQQTLANMNSQSMFSKASDLLLGRIDDTDVQVDMPPASAICQAGGEYVFSLHSDASIRRWRLGVHELCPSQVQTLKVDALASPESWSDSSGAVSLAAQLYQSVYALAISIQTVGTDETKSPCQLVVVDGSQNEQEEGDLVRSVLNLAVPKAATSVVGLDLANERCSLTALFQSNENDLDSTLFVTYPPSVVSILSTEPMVTPHENTLDGVASSERARITELSFPVANGGTCLEDDLHSVDAAFLQYLFRPAFPRGGTGVVPRASCIRSAIQKLVPGHYTTTVEKMSMELETLRAMHEWRRIDSRRVASPVRPRATTNTIAATPGGTSVYDAYARHDQDGTPDMNMDESDVEGEEDLLDQEREAQVESHEQRWRELLLAVWNEEESLLEPLCLSSLQSAGPANFALVRAGVTSVLKEVELVHDPANKWEDLDRAAMTLLERIENSHDGLSKLNSTQNRIFEEIAKASLILSPGSIGASEQELANINTELDESNDYHFNADEIAATLRESSLDDTLDWLQSVDSLFSLGLPGASVLPDSAEVLDDDADKSWSNRIADVQTRLAASSLFVQCSDSVRRLSLARFLLLSNLNGEDSSSEDGPIRQAAFRAYLFSLSVLWSCAQRVPMPPAGFLGRNRNVEFGGLDIESSPSDSPPTKRISFGDTTSSILVDEGSGHSNMTTMLDARFIQISQEHSQTLFETGSPDGSVVTMVRICMNSTFSAAPSDSLPELGVLPTPSDESVASDYPRIALRLIAPFYAFPSFNEDQDVKLARKEALAECLLIEANAESQKGPSFDSLVNTLQLRACDLLAPFSTDAMPSVDHNLLETVFLTLSKQSQDMPAPADLDEIDETKAALANEFQLLLTGSPGRPGAEITRLCRQPTVISVFLPLMATENKSFFRSLEELSHASVKSMAEVLLRISQLMHRLSILERHSGSLGGFGRNESSGKSDFLLGYIEQAISEFQSRLPSSVYNSMSEYAALWTLLFNHSVTSRRWTTAHTVCVSHPVPGRRVENYKRLVIAMVNAGAVSDLVDLCSMVTCSEEAMGSLGDKGAYIDFYEIAVETLSQERQGDPYENGSVSTDFLGCLYAVHVSRGHWGRAAQAMDAKYTLALNAVSSSMGLMERTASIVNVTAAANDLVLSSLAASNALHSINDPSKEFLISGEVGPYPSLPLAAKPEEVMESEDGFSATNKRDRNGLGWKSPRRVDPSQTTDVDEESRLSRFMTVADLNARAARAMALWIFLHEKTGDVSSIDIESFTSPSAEGDRISIDRLASLGYYDQAILLAKAVDTQYEERSCGAKPGGHGLLQDFVMQILSYVLPVALSQRNIRPSNDEMDTDELVERPTLSQLRRSIEEAGDVSTSPFSFVLGETWYPQPELPAKATASGAMDLTRKLTTEFSSSSSPIALEVASMFLDIDPSGASFPLWLERLLLGIHDDESVGGKPGLFAHHASSSDGKYSGDPSGLVSLYMKRGLYSKACGIVSALLSGTLDGNADLSRESRAPARLPEKGDIDFVPYAKIDTLWGLIDRVLSKPATSVSEKKRLEESRNAMEAALEKHFQLMKISEQGMQSARALTQ